MSIRFLFSLDSFWLNNFAWKIRETENWYLKHSIRQQQQKNYKQYNHVLFSAKIAIELPKIKYNKHIFL